MPRRPAGIIDYYHYVLHTQAMRYVELPFIFGYYLARTHLWRAASSRRFLLMPHSKLTMPEYAHTVRARPAASTFGIRLCRYMRASVIASGLLLFYFSMMLYFRHYHFSQEMRPMPLMSYQALR